MLGALAKTYRRRNHGEAVAYVDVRVDSAHRDMVLIRGSPLESEPVLVSGKVILAVREDVLVKRISLQLLCEFKLDFVQLARSRGGALASIVKERQKLLECVWDNVMCNGEGVLATTERHGLVPTNSGLSSSSSPDSSSSSAGFSGFGSSTLLRRKQYSIIDLPATGFQNLHGHSKSTQPIYRLRKGNYELPFRILLPSDIPETVEGLQSGSILYRFKCTVERKRMDNLDLSTPNSSDTKKIYKYKYLRVIRTLSNDNLAMEEEVSVGDTWRDKLQYQVKIPSRAIPLGGQSPISIKLFPFVKGYALQKITCSILQYYIIKDKHNEEYDDEIVITKQSMSTFGDLVEPETHKLTDMVELNSLFNLPDNLRVVTQDCDTPMRNELIRVRHKLAVRIMLTSAQGKNLEIKANLPILLFISPQVPIKGRLVFFDETNNGKIHFRPGQYVPLFSDSSLHNLPWEAIARPDSANSNDRNTGPTGMSSLQTSFLPHSWSPLAPPNYNDRNHDILVQDPTMHYSQLLQEAQSPRTMTPISVVLDAGSDRDSSPSQNIIIPNETPSYDQVQGYESHMMVTHDLYHQFSPSYPDTI